MLQKMTAVFQIISERLKMEMKQSAPRSRSTSDARRSNCEAPERTAADRRRHPCK